jgi:hypothetical protein
MARSKERAIPFCSIQSNLDRRQSLKRDLEMAFDINSSANVLAAVASG